MDSGTLYSIVRTDNVYRLTISCFIIYLTPNRMQLVCGCCVVNYFALSCESTLKAEMEQQKQKNEELEKKLQETATLQARDSHESDAG